MVYFRDRMRTSGHRPHLNIPTDTPTAAPANSTPTTAPIAKEVGSICGSDLAAACAG
eukprot:CAMPEP_0182897606 /NCGR_PEP_ID=MMETSP0034_2-20130328/26987_1 /TAXON_ID=156128 /ORGANISM="Nephroselmis pyriformis, Strain CCMP717" /LENGTH=56 /DNA_ID=CAMNT_0025031535 /DNA_START=66 /DNA_END=232 /DNA_ORIENTATION=-